MCVYYQILKLGTTYLFFRTPRDGCNNDSFAVFGFLAFLLAGANLLLSGRRKRSM